MKKINFNFKNRDKVFSELIVCTYLTNQNSNTIKNIWLMQECYSLKSKKVKNNKLRKFCILTNRFRGHYSKLRLSRTQVRDWSTTGILSGLQKSSW